MSCVAGLGLATPFGLGVQQSVQRWRSGESVLRTNDRWPTDGFPRTDAGLVPDFRPRKQLPDRKAVKLMSRETQLGVWAAVEAAAGTNAPQRLGIEAERFGAFAAAGYEVSAMGDSEEMLHASRDPDRPHRLSVGRLFAEGRDLYNPLSPLKILPNMALFHAGVALGLRGPHLSLGSSPAAGLAALGEACEAIEHGEADAALVLATDAQVEEFRAQLLVAAGVLPALAPGEAAAALILQGDGEGPRILGWGLGQEPVERGFGDVQDGGACRRELYAEVVARAGTPDLCLADLWDIPERDRIERDALPGSCSSSCRTEASRPRAGWLGAAHGLVDVTLAAELVRRGTAKRVLVTASGLAGDIAAVMVGVP